MLEKEQGPYRFKIKIFKRYPEGATAEERTMSLLDGTDEIRLTHELDEYEAYGYKYRETDLTSIQMNFEIKTLPTAIKCY